MGSRAQVVAHEHKIADWPQNGTGYGICECGGAVRVENGKQAGDWHTCALCTHPHGLPKQGAVTK